MQVDKCSLEYFINKKVIFESLDLYLATIRLFRELKSLLYEKMVPFSHFYFWQSLLSRKSLSNHPSIPAFPHFTLMNKPYEKGKLEKLIQTNKRFLSKKFNLKNTEKWLQMGVAVGTKLILITFLVAWRCRPRSWFPTIKSFTGWWLQSSSSVESLQTSTSLFKYWGRQT